MDLSAMGKRIRKRRKEKHLRQEDLAEIIGCCPAYIGMIERGEKMPGLQIFVDLANALDFTADELLADELWKGHAARMTAYAEKISTLRSDKQKSVYNIMEATLDALLKEL